MDTPQQNNVRETRYCKRRIAEPGHEIEHLPLAEVNVKSTKSIEHPAPENNTAKGAGRQRTGRTNQPAPGLRIQLGTMKLLDMTINRVQRGLRRQRLAP